MSQPQVKKMRQGMSYSCKEKTIILNVFKYFRIEFTGICVTEIVRRTAKATGCSEKSIFLFRKEEASAEGFKEPSKTKIRKNININSRDVKYDNTVRQAIRNIVYDLKYRSIIPSLNTILKQVNAEAMLPNFSLMTLRRLLFDMGFTYEKSGNKSILVEKSMNIIKDNLQTSVKSKEKIKKSAVNHAIKHEQSFNQILQKPPITNIHNQHPYNNQNNLPAPQPEKIKKPAVNHVAKHEQSFNQILQKPPIPITNIHNHHPFNNQNHLPAPQAVPMHMGTFETHPHLLRPLHPSHNMSMTMLNARGPHMVQNPWSQTQPPLINAQSEPIRVVVTGAAGQIAYSLLYLVAKGDVFGANQPIILHLLDIPPMMGVLEGVVMELADCALPLLRAVVPTADPAEAFKDVSAAFLVGAMPRKQGMERKDLLGANVKIFQVQGEALDKFAKKNVKVLVVGNPANTNALVCSKYAPSIPKQNFTAMTRLDQNRAQAQIAKKLNVPVGTVSNLIIWGNHSSTQFPDASHALVSVNGSSTKAVDEIQDDIWLRGEFLETVQKRGAAVIAARKMSSAMSAAKAAADHMKDWFMGTAPGQFVSMGVISDGSYGAPKDIIFSFPVTIKNNQWTIMQGLPMDAFSEKMIDITGKELLEEQTDAFDVINNKL